MNKLRIATRESALALWQARHVASALKQHYPTLTVELVPMTTRGDQLLDTPLAQIGGKGLFLKELEVAMLEGRADLAVHSMKDVPVDMPEGMCIAAILEREDPSDAFVSNHHVALQALPEGAVVGTSSLRRQAMLKHQRPDLQIRDLRGNVNTRLAKLDAGDYDAIVLASAGLIRLDMADRIRDRLNPPHCLPAAAQGAVGIEVCSNAQAVIDLVSVLQDDSTAACIHAERAFSQRLGGSCHVPLAAYATLQDDTITLDAMVAAIDGSKVLSARQSGPVGQAENLGLAAAEDVLSQGAQEILDAANPN